MHRDAAYWIERLGLSPHPEGGHFVRTYSSEDVVARECLPERFGGDRHHATSIYYLLAGQEFSAFHRIKSDEIWHHYEGCSVRVHILEPGRALRVKTLGKEVEKGESFQVVVHAGCWFGALLAPPRTHALMGCTVSPGFDPDDFELALREKLLEEFPAHEEIIRRLTR